MSLSQCSQVEIKYDGAMDFDWDEWKNESNLAKNGFDFADAFQIFDLPIVVDLDDRENDGEDRWVEIGLWYGRIIIVLYVDPNEETIHVSSLRKALAHVQRRYEKYFKN